MTPLHTQLKVSVGSLSEHTLLTIGRYKGGKQDVALPNLLLATGYYDRTFIFYNSF